MTGGQVRAGAWVADITGLPGLPCWPAGCGSSSVKSARTRGAQLRFPGAGGHRFGAFATDTRRGQFADLEPFRGGYNDVCELVCPGCGDDLDLDFSEVLPRRQWLRGRRTLEEGVAVRAGSSGFRGRRRAEPDA